jgi:hypothetical protein
VVVVDDVVVDVIVVVDGGAVAVVDVAASVLVTACATVVIRAGAVVEARFCPVVDRVDSRPEPHPANAASAPQPRIMRTTRRTRTSCRARL